MAYNFFFTALLCQLMAAFAWAAPLVDESFHAAKTDAWEYGTGGGIIGLIVLILDIIIFVEVVKSNRPVSSKLIWCLVVFFFPVVGMIVYYLFSHREAHNTYEPLP